jgi:hypothetical protein
LAADPDGEEKIPLPDPAVENREELQLFVLRARSLGIEFVHVASCVEVDLMSQCFKKVRRFGAYCATTCGVVVNAENHDEGETKRGIVCLAD